MINEQRDRQTDRKSQISRARGILFASPAPTGSQVLRSSDTHQASPWCCNMAAALACVGAKRLIFILVTHTNRTAERQCSREGGLAVVPERPVRSLEVARPRRERDKRAPSKAFQPPATETVITAVATQRSSSLLGKAPQNPPTPRTSHV